MRPHVLLFKHVCVCVVYSTVERHSLTRKRLSKVNIACHRPTHILKVAIPYSGKLLREKTFANFADLCSAAKVFSANFWGRGMHAHVHAMSMATPMQIG